MALPHIPEPVTMKRKEILEAAITHTCGERNIAYGEPVVNMTNTAHLIAAFLEIKAEGRIISTTQTNTTYVLTAEDAAMILLLVKMARTPSKACGQDTFEDMAAYAAIAGECT